MAEKELAVYTISAKNGVIFDNCEENKVYQYQLFKRTV